MAPRFLVQRLWCHVKTVRPDDGACLRIDSYLSEVARVAQGLKDAGPCLRREVDVTDRTVIEQQAQSILADHRYADNGRQIRHHFHLMGEARWERAVPITGPAPNWPPARPCAGQPILERSPERGPPDAPQARFRPLMGSASRRAPMPTCS